MNREEIIQLMDCMNIDARPVWRGEYRLQSTLELVIQLVKIGVSLDVRPPKSLWILFWSMILRDKTVFERSLDATMVEQAIGLFLESGVEPFPIITLPTHFVGRVDKFRIVFLCEVDMALLPCIHALFNDVQKRDFERYILQRSELSKARKVQILFEPRAFSDSSGFERGYHMTDEDVQSLHQNLQASLVADDRRRYFAAKRKFCQTLVSMYNHVTSSQEEGENWLKVPTTASELGVVNNWLVNPSPYI